MFPGIQRARTPSKTIAHRIMAGRCPSQRHFRQAGSRALCRREGNPPALVRRRRGRSHHALAAQAGPRVSWVELAPELVRDHRVIVPDLPATVAPHPCPRCRTSGVFADRVALLLEREGAHPAVLVGHSLGCVVALRGDAEPGARPWPGADLGRGDRFDDAARARYALAVSSLVQPGRLIARERIARSDFCELWCGGAGPRRTARSRPRRPSGCSKGPHCTRILRAPGRHSSRRILASTSTACIHPAMLVWGARDPQVPVDDAFEYAQRLRAPLRVVAGAGHLVIAERPEACLDAIRALLGGPGG